MLYNKYSVEKVLAYKNVSNNTNKGKWDLSRHLSKLREKVCGQVLEN
jgi:hypothetical protein